MSEDQNHSHSVAVEDYIKHIWKLERRHQRATTKALSERLKLGRGTVSGMLKHLAERGLVIHQPYHGASLTDAGTRLALRIIRRHRLVELFLVQTLGLGWEEVHHDAEQIEHAISDELIDRIDAFLGHPPSDPHGAPIPSASGEMARQDLKSLATMQKGDKARICRVSDRDSCLLRDLEKMGIELGAQVEVSDVDRFGLMRLKVENKEIVLAAQAADHIEVQHC